LAGNLPTSPVLGQWGHGGVLASVLAAGGRGQSALLLPFNLLSIQLWGHSSATGGKIRGLLCRRLQSGGRGE
jgi:hypothetical protein